LTVNTFVAPEVAELVLPPALALAELLPGAEAEEFAWSGLPLVAPALEFMFPAAAPCCPVTCTSFPTKVRMLSRFPTSL
jgi:hypothetical protein